MRWIRASLCVKLYRVYPKAKLQSLPVIPPLCCCSHHCYTVVQLGSSVLIFVVSTSSSMVCCRFWQRNKAKDRGVEGPRKKQKLQQSPFSSVAVRFTAARFSLPEPTKPLGDQSGSCCRKEHTETAECCPDTELYRWRRMCPMAMDDSRATHHDCVAYAAQYS